MEEFQIKYDADFFIWAILFFTVPPFLIFLYLWLKSLSYYFLVLDIIYLALYTYLGKVAKEETDHDSLQTIMLWGLFLVFVGLVNFFVLGDTYSKAHADQGLLGMLVLSIGFLTFFNIFAFGMSAGVFKSQKAAKAFTIGGYVQVILYFIYSWLLGIW